LEGPSKEFIDEKEITSNDTHGSSSNINNETLLQNVGAVH
jgi:hypothetical protein